MTRTQPSHVEVREKPRKGEGAEEAADEMEAADETVTCLPIFSNIAIAEVQLEGSEVLRYCAWNWATLSRHCVSLELWFSM